MPNKLTLAALMTKTRTAGSIRLVLAILLFSSPMLFAIEYNTGDGLDLTVATSGDDEGRVTLLEMNGQAIDFCGDETGGFYIRDYTIGIDSATGLPHGLDSIGNMLDCADFENDCVDCLVNELTRDWKRGTNVSTPSIECVDVDLIDNSTTTVAKIGIPQTPTSETYYFTVLNNEEMTVTLLDLSDNAKTPDHAEKSMHEVFSHEEVLEYDICSLDYDCEDDFPSECPGYFAQRSVDFYLDIMDASKLGLWNGNIECVQLVSNPENGDVCNWPEIIDEEFSPGNPSSEYSIKRIFQLPHGLLRIGGPWIATQYACTIEDKALMVFKLTASTLVDNGEGETRSGSSSQSEAASGDYAGVYYERHGSSWQRLEAAGFNQNVDVIPSDAQDAFAISRIDIGERGEYEVLVHFPVSESGCPSTLYEVFLSDYSAERRGDAALGEPVLSTIIDQSDADWYAASMNDVGFVSLGTVSINVESPEVLTVAIKLSTPRDQDSEALNNTYLLSDAVKLSKLD